MPVDRKALAKAQAEVDNAQGGVKFWKTKEGRSKFRLIVDWPGNNGVYFRDVATHYKVGPEKKSITCTKMTSTLAKQSGKECYLCDKVLELMSSEDESAQAAGKELRATTRYLMNIFVRNTGTEGGGLKIGQFPRTVHEAIYEFVFNPEDHGEITDLIEGNDIIVERKGSGLDTKYKVSLAKIASPLSTNEREIKQVLEQAVDLNRFINFTDEETMRAAFGGDDEEEEVAKERKRTPVAVDDDEDETPAEGASEDDDEEPTPPVKKKKKPAPAPVDDDDDEASEDSDDEDEDDPPVKKAKAAPATATLAGLRSRLGR